MRVMHSISAMLAVVMGLTLVPLSARAEYPDRPVIFIVPYSPGGTTDMLARTLGHMLEQRLGQPFVIENKPGASSVVAATQVAKAPADGYTILMATSTTMAINAAVFKKLSYTPLIDLSPISMVATVPFILVINESLPAHSVADLIDLAKSKPGELSYGSSGPGSAAQLFMQQLASITGIKLTHVPYRGTAPALYDVVAGRTQMMFADVSTALPLIRAGKLRALGVSTAKRLPNAPDLPTLAEAGVPGYEASSWQMIVGPANMPKDIIQKLYDALQKTQADPAFTAAVAARGVIPEDSSPPLQLHKFVADEIVRWGKVVEDAGVAHSM
jgi:tripartite-type tricarboxylate transporter receptor subunit TctC